MSGILGGQNLWGSKSGIIGQTELDYEEGTWTVAVSGADASLGHTTGHYTKVGKRVWYDWYSSATTFSNASGAAAVTLPFTAIDTANLYPVFNYQHGNAVDGSSRGGYVQKGDNKLYFIDDGTYTGATYVNGSSKYIMVSGSFTIA